MRHIPGHKLFHAPQSHISQALSRTDRTLGALTPAWHAHPEREPLRAGFQVCSCMQRFGLAHPRTPSLHTGLGLL